MSTACSINSDSNTASVESRSNSFSSTSLISSNSSTSSTSTSSSSCSGSGSGSGSGSSEDESVAGTNLIVNYLPAEMTSGQFRELFEKCGVLLSCRLIVDHTSGHNLGYGFVRFVRGEDAQRAIQTVNGCPLGRNKRVKVSHARPSCDAIRGANLYVCGLPRAWTERELEACFAPCGRIVCSRVLMQQPNEQQQQLQPHEQQHQHSQEQYTGGQSKGVAFLRFESRSEAENAIRMLHGTAPMPGALEPLTVKFANTPLDRRESSSLFAKQPHIGPSQWSQSSSDCRWSSSSLMDHDAYSKKSLNAGGHHEVVEHSRRLTQTPDQMRVPSWSSLSLSLSSPQPVVAEQRSGWCIFVYNLPAESEDSQLWQLFGPFGAVQHVRVMRNAANQQCKGFGFVTMTCYEEAVNAIRTLHGATLGKRTLQVSFKVRQQSPQQLN